MKDIDKILEQIRNDEKEVFSPNYICSKKKNKLNWSGMHLNSFRLRVYSGEIKSTKYYEGMARKYKITKRNLLDWLMKQNYGQKN